LQSFVRKASETASIDLGKLTVGVTNLPAKGWRSVNLKNTEVKTKANRERGRMTGAAGAH